MDDVLFSFWLPELNAFHQSSSQARFLVHCGRTAARIAASWNAATDVRGRAAFAAAGTAKYCGVAETGARFEVLERSKVEIGEVGAPLTVVDSIAEPSDVVQDEAGLIAVESPDTTVAAETTSVEAKAEASKDELPSPSSPELCTALPVAPTDPTVALAAALMVAAAADESNTNVPPAPTVKDDPAGKALELVTMSVPDDTAVPPLYVFTPESVTVPGPAMTTPWEPPVSPMLPPIAKSPAAASSVWSPASTNGRSIVCVFVLSFVMSPPRSTELPLSVNAPARG